MGRIFSKGVTSDNSTGKIGYHDQKCKTDNIKSDNTRKTTENITNKVEKDILVKENTILRNDLSPNLTLNNDSKECNGNKNELAKDKNIKNKFGPEIVSDDWSAQMKNVGQTKNVSSKIKNLVYEKIKRTNNDHLIKNSIDVENSSLSNKYYARPTDQKVTNSFKIRPSSPYLNTIPHSKNNLNPSNDNIFKDKQMMINEYINGFNLNNVAGNPDSTSLKNNANSSTENKINIDVQERNCLPTTKKEDSESFKNNFVDNIQIDENYSEDGKFSQNFKLNNEVNLLTTKRKLRAPPPSLEKGSVLIEKIIPIGEAGDLISWNKSKGPPSSSFYVAPSRVKDGKGGPDILPPYDWDSERVIDDDRDFGLGEDATLQDLTSVQAEMQPAFDDVDFVPAARWLDVDYKYSTYLKQPRSADSKDFRTKFNFDDYKVNDPTIEKEPYLLILENLNSITKLGLTPDTFNAYWLKETILRWFEHSGLHQTKYYDKQGNEYSHRSKKPNYTLAEWAKEYLSKEPPAKKEPANEVTDVKDKKGNDQGIQVDQKSARQSRMNTQSKKSKENITNKKSHKNKQKEKDIQSKAPTIDFSIYEKRKQINIIPKEREEEIYKTLLGGGDTNELMQSLLNPENQLKILKELAKPDESVLQSGKVTNIQNPGEPVLKKVFDKAKPENILRSEKVPNLKNPKEPALDKVFDVAKPEPISRSENITDSKKPKEPDLEKVYEIMLGDNLEEKQAIYDMMREPVGKERVYEALCRIGSEKYPEFYESYSEDEDIYPSQKATPRSTKTKQKEVKRKKRDIIIQTYPFPGQASGQTNSKSTSADNSDNDYDPNDLNHNAYEQHQAFEVMRMVDSLHPQNEEVPQKDKTSRPTPLKNKTPSWQNQTSPLTNQIHPFPEDIYKTNSKTPFQSELIHRESNSEMGSKTRSQNEIFQILSTPEGRQKVFDALCQIGRSHNPDSYVSSEAE